MNVSVPFYKGELKMKLDEQILSKVFKDTLERDDLEGADEVTTLSIMEIVENSIASYIKLKKEGLPQ